MWNRVPGARSRCTQPQGQGQTYPVYAALRAASPVHRLGPASVLLTRHADVMAVYSDPAASSDKQPEFEPKFGAGTPLFQHHTTSLVFSDPPLHTRVRRLLLGA
jgi:cytochrome P450